MAQWSAGGRGVKEAKLRAACGRHGLAAERGLIKGTWRLIHEDIGHAIYNEAARRGVFSLDEALRYMRTLDAVDAKA